MPSQRKRPELNVNQEAFCQSYVNGEKELFGNGVQCYLEIYQVNRLRPNWYKTACSAASQLLSNIKVINRIRVLLEEGGFSDENITKQHLFLINQHTDLGTKMRAISDFYKLKGKYAPEKSEMEVTFPKPIYGGSSTIPIQRHESNSKDISTKKKD